MRRKTTEKLVIVLLMGIFGLLLVDALRVSAGASRMMENGLLIWQEHKQWAWE
jgi:hypothetical protein